MLTYRVILGDECWWMTTTRLVRPAELLWNAYTAYSEYQCEHLRQVVPRCTLKQIIGYVARDSSDSKPDFVIFGVSRILGSRAKQREVRPSRWQWSSSSYWEKVELVCHNVYPHVLHTSYLPWPEFWPEFCHALTETCCFIHVASLETVWYLRQLLMAQGSENEFEDLQSSCNGIPCDTVPVFLGVRDVVVLA